MRHGAYEPTAPKHHWSGWYAAYVVARERGKTPDDAAAEATLTSKAPPNASMRSLSHAPDIVPGAAFPDYDLSDHRGQRRKLSDLQEIDPLVLVLARGGFCPKERRQHEGARAAAPRDAGRLLPPRDDLDRQPARDERIPLGVGAQWTFLSDPGGESRRTSTFQEYTDPTTIP
jgi:hypothetical protein